MEEIGNLLGGFSVALTVPNLLYMLVGITLAHTALAGQLRAAGAHVIAGDYAELARLVA